ncbi:hypothetical protein A3D66_02490 [Candidatus Kaiserbacteria bacterium RIFCSPHIGHO2_02_FULL_50_9]|nr:MAG: hypothetical protein A2761_03175 [Candidatus Kaiserbacteria bacterium RIFCSPHIGHO2_01_FULL_51_33]OGG63805.1 MAG: hypothetical protein A3D66_02490 [Candidatus Kaiserbacteria bacterium RIFCSPHIGHO2_02_FULL_50_9]
MSPKRIIGVILLVGIAAVAYYGISPLFRKVTVNEQPPAVQTSALQESMPNEAETTTSVIGTTLHPASGSARVIEGDSGKKYLRYENFKTINGPDLYVYLSKDLDAKEFVNLGRIRGTEGNINYEIPADVNPAEYPYALTWCKQFSVLFNYVKLY